MALQAWFPLSCDLLDYGPHKLSLTSNTGAALNSSTPTSGGSAYFNNHYLLYSLSTEFKDSFTNINTLSISGWIKSNTTGYKQWAKIGTNSTGWNDIRFGFDCTSANYFCVSDGTNTTSTTNASDSIVDNIWHHVVGIYDNGTMYQYVDGTLVKTTTTTIIPNISTSTGIYIGGSGSGERVAPGYVKDVRFYNHILTEDEILKLYKRGEKGLIFWMPCTDGTIKNQGLYYCNPTSEAYTSNGNGKIGSCIHSTGAINTNLPFSMWDYRDGIGHSISFGGWFKFNQTEILNAIKTLTYNSTHPFPTGNLLGFNSYGGFSLDIRSADNYSSTPTSLLGVNIYTYLRDKTSGQDTSVLCQIGANYAIHWDEWVHLMIVYNQAEKTILGYVNGEKTFTQVISRAVTNINESSFLINTPLISGGNGPGCSFPCYINDIRIYNKALSEKEIKKITQAQTIHYQLNHKDIQPNLNLFNTYVNTGINSINNYAVNQTGSFSLENMSNGLPAIKFTTTQSSSTPGIRMPAVTLKANTNYTFSGILESNCKVILDNYTLTIPATTDGTRPSNVNDAYTVYPTPTYVYGTFNSGSSTEHLFYVFTVLNGSGTWWVKLSQLQLTEGTQPIEYIPNLYNNNIYDSSGFIHNGLKYESNYELKFDTARYKHSINFTGSNDCRIFLPFAQSLGITSAKKTDNTISVWFYRPGYGSGWDTIVGVGNYEIEASYSSPPEGHTRNEVLLYNYSDKPSVPYDSSKWHHLVLVYTNDNTKMYLDGQLQKTTAAQVTLPASINNWTLAGYNNSNNQLYHGQLSDFRIFATALTADDVQELYAMGHPPTT